MLVIILTRPSKCITHVYTLSIQNIKNTCSFHYIDQVNSGESYDPLLMSLIKSTSISVDEGEETMKSQLTFTPEVLTCCTLDNYCDYYYLTMLVIYEHLKILAMFCYNLHPAQPEEDWPPLIAWFLSRFLPRFWPF